MSGKDETDVVYTINEGKALRSSNQINKTHLTLIGEIRDMTQIVNWKTQSKLRIGKLIQNFITGKLIQNKEFSRKILFHNFRNVTQTVLLENSF